MAEAEAGLGYKPICIPDDGSGLTEISKAWKMARIDEECSNALFDDLEHWNKILEEVGFREEDGGQS